MKTSSKYKNHRIAYLGIEFIHYIIGVVSIPARTLEAQYPTSKSCTYVVGLAGGTTKAMPG